MHLIIQLFGNYFFLWFWIKFFSLVFLVQIVFHSFSMNNLFLCFFALIFKFNSMNALIINGVFHLFCCLKDLTLIYFSLISFSLFFKISQMFWIVFLWNQWSQKGFGLRINTSSLSIVLSFALYLFFVLFFLFCK